MSQTTCETCNTLTNFAWTDVHGIAQCWTCGTPYRLLHYDEQGKRLELPPSSIVDEEYKPLLRQYWEESHRHIPSGCSFPGGQELATAEEHRLFNEWMKSHKPENAEEVQP
jgi:hypothetical protein